MNFGIERKGYKRTEVDEYVYALKNEYEQKLGEQKNRIFELKNELSEKDKEISSLKERSDLISAAIVKAVEKADEIEQLAAARYREEMDRLRAFHEKWQAHYNKLLSRYPDDDGLRAEEQFNAAMDDILSGGSAAVQEIEQVFEAEKNRVSAAKTAPHVAKTAAKSAPASAKSAPGSAGSSAKSTAKSTAKTAPGSTGSAPKSAGKSAPASAKSAAGSAHGSAKPAGKITVVSSGSAPGSSAARKPAKKQPRSLAENDTSESGFSFNEAWNPTDDLASIMKDLGLGDD